MAELPLQKQEVGLVSGAVFPREALYYEKLTQGRVRCLLCNHRCEIPQERTGICKARTNKDGILYTSSFSNPCAVHVEPIEKEPMYHYLPGTMTLSIATAGCNLRCSYCQNWLISQFSPEESMNYFRSPGDILELARANSCPTINFTYSEPTIFYEYMLEVAEQAKSIGIKSICHSNGFMNKEVLLSLCKILDAVCVDLKGFEEEFYRNICGASLSPVLNNLKIMKSEGIHLELVTLVVPGLNDGLATIKKMCQWIAGELGPDTPLHFLKFNPRFKLKDADPTQLDILEKCRETALSCGLNYAYISNAPSDSAKITYCPQCKNKLIERSNNEAARCEIRGGMCRHCNSKIAGYWN